MQQDYDQRLLQQLRRWQMRLLESEKMDREGVRGLFANLGGMGEYGGMGPGTGHDHGQGSGMWMGGMHPGMGMGGMYPGMTMGGMHPAMQQQYGGMHPGMTGGRPMHPGMFDFRAQQGYGVGGHPEDRWASDPRGGLSRNGFGGPMRAGGMRGGRYGEDYEDDDGRGGGYGGDQFGRGGRDRWGDGNGE